MTSMQRSKVRAISSNTEEKNGAFKVTITADEKSSDSESIGLVVQHTLSAYSDAHEQWILNSGVPYSLAQTPQLLPNFVQCPFESDD